MDVKRKGLRETKARLGGQRRQKSNGREWAGGKEEKDQKRDTGSKTLVYITAYFTIIK
jgi:hypothetical protein